MASSPLAVLKMGRVPKNLAPFRDRFNSLVGVIESIEGNLGIDVKIVPPPTPKPKVAGKQGEPKPSSLPQGKIKITSVPAAITTPAAGSSSSSNQVHPFQIVPGSGSNVQVTQWGRLIAPLDTSYSDYSISNMGADLAISAGYDIVLHVQMTAGFSITSCAIEASASTGTQLAFSGSDQTDLWYVIGHVSSATGITAPYPGLIVGSLFVEQWCFTNLRLCTFCANGQAAIYPVPA